MRTHNIGLLLCITIATLLTTARSAHAGIPVFFSWGGEKVVKVGDFPDTEDFKTSDGKYLDPGYRYKQISIFFVPIWNYGRRWCGYVGDSRTYLDLSKDDLEVFANAAGLKLPATPSLPFWESYGGKLLFVVVFAFFVIANNSSADAPEPLEDKSQSPNTVA